ncbi:MAG: hypothetical protein GY950_14755, partial [bacterium]|nr:hypothetical protein [bacterium]
ARVKISLEQGVYLPLYHLGWIFQLTPLELDILLVCLAPELDVKYEKIYAYLQDDVTKKAPSVNLIMDLLCRTGEEKTDARACFQEQSPLLKYDLVTLIDENQPRPLISRGLKLDDRIVSFMLQQDITRSGLPFPAKMLTPTRDWSSLLMESPHRDQLSRLAEEFVKAPEKDRAVFYLKGPYGAGKKLTAEAFCFQLKLPLLIIDVNQLLQLMNRESDCPCSPGKIVRWLFREALLQSSAIYLDYFDRLLPGTPQNSL